MRVCLTGAGGFVGHHVLEHIMVNTSWDVVATDSFRHRGKTDRIAQVLEDHPNWRPRLHVVTHDLSAPFTEQMIWRMGKIDHIIAMASESHVDRSLEDPVPFVRNNTNVALSVLEYARTVKPKSVIWMSTDEVYGPVGGDDLVGHPEWSPIIPSNPYSASKAAQEAIAISYWRSYGVPVILINGMNLIGERQDPEKFLPKIIKAVVSDAELTIHGKQDDIGTRHYLHCRNLADGILHIIKELPPAAYPAHAKHRQVIADRPDRYNVAAKERTSNLDLARMVARACGRSLRYRLVDFHSARPGHDPHYGLDPSKLEAAGWKPPVDLEESLAKTVRWTLAHPEWLL